jgi:hypothetical protein
LRRGLPAGESAVSARFRDCVDRKTTGGEALRVNHKQRRNGGAELRLVVLTRGATLTNLQWDCSDGNVRFDNERIGFVLEGTTVKSCRPPRWEMQAI